MRPILDEYGLRVVTTHRNFNDFTKDIDEIIDYNKTLGCDLFGVGIMPPECSRKHRNNNGFYKPCK